MTEECVVALAYRISAALKTFVFLESEVVLKTCDSIFFTESEVVRSVHLLELGRRIAESLRNLRLLSLEETKSGKMNFHSGIQVRALYCCILLYTALYRCILLYL